MTIEMTLSDGTIETAHYHKPIRKNPEPMTHEKFYKKMCALYAAGHKPTDEYVRPISYKVIDG